VEDMLKVVHALTRVEFNNATASSSVYGKYRQGIFVYIELGKELTYEPHPNDDPRYEYRLFKDCYIEYAATLEILISGEYATYEDNQLVKLYW
jgi:hypothetical protein